MIIEISDDGKGIDSREIVEKAKRRGIETTDLLDSTTLLEILCTPGFSTKAEADRASGRGVGMGLLQRLEIRQGQSLVMTPQLLQAIKLLEILHGERPV